MAISQSEAGRQPDLQAKSFECTHPSCNKRFTRAEHLQRHALNHAPGGLACEICRAHFKRPDLLRRHMERHRQRDLEAGGPGCGALDTRKRAWETNDGKVVEKRPCLDDEDSNQSSKNTDRRQEPSEEISESQTSNSQCENPQFRLDNQLVSILGQTNNPLEANNLPQLHRTTNDIGIYDPTASQDHLRSDQARSNLFEISLQDISELEYDQVFQPDTASSFNMPFTTSVDYNWLFSTQEFSLPIEKSTINPFNSTGDLSAGSMPTFPVSPQSMDSAQLWSEPTTESTNQEMAQSGAAMQRQIPRRAGTSPNIVSQPRRSTTCASTTAVARNPAPKRRNPVTVDQTPPPERPFSSIHNMSIPEMDEDIRESILTAIEASNPQFPEQQCSIWEEPLLCLESLQTYLELFFIRFNTSYPLIHLASFDPENSEPLLLLSILLLGATYSGKDSHQLAVCIHDCIRPSIFAHAGFSPQPSLWTLQTILLVECFGKSRAGQKQHEMSHLFHGLLINLIRRSDCQSIQPVGPPPTTDGHYEEKLREAWQRWSVAEQKKRLAMLCFMWDTQHAVLFCQSLCMSAFELRASMPCAQPIWEAKDPAMWAAAWRSTPSADHGIPYLMALKSYLSPSVPRPSTLGMWARVLILHGLMSIAWDMGRRDQTALGVVGSTESGTTWKHVIGTAYDHWHNEFDAHCTALIARLQNRQKTGRDDSEETLISEITSYAASYQALYHAAQSLLHMDFLDIQIYAGARHILGRPVQQRDYLRSAQVVKRWAAASTEEDVTSGPPESGRMTTPSARLAASHAAHLLHFHINTLIGSEAMSLFHVPWCMYLVTLTCWAYHHARPSGRQRGGSAFNAQEDSDDVIDEDDEMVWNPQREMEVLVAGMVEAKDKSSPSVARRQTNGLVWIMAELLTKVRWGIVHAGVTVLRGLVPQRLINQYDEPWDR